jgi:hypothetical protein
MAQSPIATILEMIIVVIVSIAQTLGALFGLFVQLLGDLEFVSSLGLMGLIMSVVIVSVVVYFLGKFVLKSGKVLLPLFIVGVIILWILILAAV